MRTLRSGVGWNRPGRAEKIQASWTEVTHTPSVLEVKQATQLAWEGHLTSLEIMRIENIDITGISTDQMGKLASIVMESV